MSYKKYNGNNNNNNNYRIAPNFRGARFSPISVFRNFAETIFADQRFRYRVSINCGILQISRSLIFLRFDAIREKRENYAPRKFGAKVIIVETVDTQNKQL